MYMNIWMQVPKITQKGWICTKYQRWATLVTGPWPPDHIPWPADHGWWPPDHPPGWNWVYDHVEWSLDHFMCHVIDPVSNKHKMVKIQPYNRASNVSEGHKVLGRGLVMSRIRGKQHATNRRQTHGRPTMCHGRPTTSRRIFHVQPTVLTANRCGGASSAVGSIKAMDPMAARPWGVAARPPT